MNEELLTMKSQDARIRMREVLDAILTGRHILITRNGREASVMVSPAWYDDARRALHDKKLAVTNPAAD